MSGASVPVVEEQPKVQFVADILPEVIALLQAGPQRMPIRNTEPREQMSGRKWFLIQERDGNRCHNCTIEVPVGFGQIDHIVPRSSFAPDELRVADRSDNLRLLCPRCNQAKSNFTTGTNARVIGVTEACWECLYDTEVDYETDPEVYDEYWSTRERPELTVLAYCGRCGYHQRVPDASWLM